MSLGICKAPSDIQNSHRDFSCFLKSSIHSFHFPLPLQWGELEVSVWNTWQADINWDCPWREILWNGKEAKGHRKCKRALRGVVRRIRLSTNWFLLSKCPFVSQNGQVISFPSDDISTALHSPYLIPAFIPILLPKHKTRYFPPSSMPSKKEVIFNFA